MSPYVIWAGVAAGRILYDWLTKPKDGVVDIQAQYAMTTSFDPDLLRRWVKECLEQRGCRPVESGSDFDLFTRGDRSVEYVPSLTDVHWLRVPMMVTAGYGMEDGERVVVLRFVSWPEVRFSKEATEAFHRESEAEYKSVLAALCTRGDEWSRQKEEARRQKYWDSPRSEPPAASNDDFTTLGLKPGASWPQIQTAYRECCRKYHPDRLNGKNVEPHLVELAVQRFKEITAAYQRLKERMVA